MYIAKRDLCVRGNKIIKAGEPVHEAEKWDEPVIRAHLNSELLTKVAGPEGIIPSLPVMEKPQSEKVGSDPGHQDQPRRDSGSGSVPAPKKKITKKG